jgi:ABC-type uncharacterized transport system ATPase component
MALDEANPLNATALKSILRETDTKIAAALERQTAALLTVAEAITLAAAKGERENLTLDLAKRMISTIFTEFLKP